MFAFSIFAYAVKRPIPNRSPYRPSYVIPTPGNTNSGGLSTVDLHIELARFVKKINNIFNKKDLVNLVKGGRLYRAFPISKTSLPTHRVKSYFGGQMSS
jgi:hypothetical protein